MYLMVSNRTLNSSGTFSLGVASPITISKTSIATIAITTAKSLIILLSWRDIRYGVSKAGGYHVIHKFM